jgi:arabinose-5-phosphate isomerase
MTRQGIKTILSEIESLQNLAENFQHKEFDKLIELTLKTEENGGKVVFLGIGKSAKIAGKTVSTLNSTGGYAICLDAGDSTHGDLGIVKSNDLLIVVSNSGESSELIPSLKFAKRKNLPIVAFCNKPESTIAKMADICLKLFNNGESACPLQVAPMSSTTNTLALGDAYAAELMVRKGFTLEDFGISHPGGALGKNLLPVTDFLDELPAISKDLTICEAAAKNNQYGLGCLVVLNEDKSLAGFISDGDLLRAFVANGMHKSVTDYMTYSPLTIDHTDLGKAALNAMTVGVLKNEEYVSVSAIIVMQDNLPIGIATMKRLRSELGS